ncbi:glycosyltransferase [Latilactobacillus sakei]|uniref:glycosyltransferase n=1 Tax=Latilactobacillus sakei TaxID=1599 RepID=UPI0024E035F3|nr:glycosyltransferase [Latilactobacillus sakei]
MKVLIINQFCGHGSTGRISTDLYDLIEKDGGECCIAYGRYSAPKGYKTYKLGGKFNSVEHALETRFFDNHGFASRFATKKFINFIKNFKPDVIHIHNLHGYYINVNILMNFLKKIDVKIVWTLHDCWPFSPRTAYIDYLENDKLPTYQDAKESKNKYPEVFFPMWNNYKRKKNAFLGFSDLTIVTPSEWLTEMTTRSFLGVYKCMTIHNGIDLKQFTPQKRNLALLEEYKLINKKIILAVASAWDDRKGLKFVNLVAKYFKNDDEYKVVVIGELKKGNIVDNNAIHIDRTDSIQSLAEWYSLAYCLLNPTLFDTFPTTNLESLACGTPVITFNTGGSPEAVDQYTGIVVNNEGITELVKAVDEVQHLSKNLCTERAKLFNKDEKFKEYLNLYKGES